MSTTFKNKEDAIALGYDVVPLYGGFVAKRVIGDKTYHSGSTPNWIPERVAGIPHISFHDVYKKEDEAWNFIVYEINH